MSTGAPGFSRSRPTSIDAPAAARLANLRGWRAAIPTSSPITTQLADRMRDRFAETSRARRGPGHSLREWRDRVLADPAHHVPTEVASAFTFLALELDFVGDTAAAADARDAAQHAGAYGREV
jgi:hypothetical protein